MNRPSQTVFPPPPPGGKKKGKKNIDQHLAIPPFSCSGSNAIFQTGAQSSRAGGSRIIHHRKWQAGLTPTILKVATLSVNSEELGNSNSGSWSPIRGARHRNSGEIGPKSPSGVGWLPVLPNVGRGSTMEEFGLVWQALSSGNQTLPGSASSRIFHDPRHGAK